MRSSYVRSGRDPSNAIMSQPLEKSSYGNMEQKFFRDPYNLRISKILERVDIYVASGNLVIRRREKT
jgi:hypothetical protein